MAGVTGSRTALEQFAREVGSEGPVCCAGGKTQWEIGGPLTAGTREVEAPRGIVAHQPEEMIVRVRAGTTLSDLQSALAERGQRVALEAPVQAARGEEATVGGLVSVGRSGLRRLGLGPVRDTVLEVTAVNSQGELIRSGAPLVKNVTGFDLCRLLAGSLGTLALVGELVLRCIPLPETEEWFAAEGVDPFDIFKRLYRPASVLWDGRRTWVGLSGLGVDVHDQAATVLGERFRQVPGAPGVPGDGRLSLEPASLARLRELAGGGGGDGGDGGGDPAPRWLAEIGVGVLHCTPAMAETVHERGLMPRRSPSPALVALHRRIKRNFDPDGRFNPGRRVLAAAAEDLR